MRNTSNQKRDAQTNIQQTTTIIIGAQAPGQQNSVAFCSPANSLTFNGLMDNPFVGKKLKSYDPSTMHQKELEANVFARIRLLHTMLMPEQSTARGRWMARAGTPLHCLRSKGQSRWIDSRSSSRDVRIRVPTFSVVYFSRGTLPQKGNGKRAPSWGT